MFFTSATDRDYELEVQHEDSVVIPKYISELLDGTIVDMAGERRWGSLPEMTQDLKAEIVEWGSEVGD